MAFDTLAFRQALGCFGTGVAVITATADGGELLGVTVNSFASVSLEPPLVLFSLDRRANSVAAYEAAGGFNVNVLGQDQLDLCQRFAQPLIDKWADTAFTTGDNGAPLLHGTLAAFECRTWQTYDGGDHVIFVGEVVKIHGGADGDPLLFFRGQYRSIADQ